MSSSPPKWECDVFVSYERRDPAKGFTEGLLKRLYQVGIAHWSETKTNAPGEFGGKRDEAFQQVRFALVVLCKSYVNTKDCFNVLVKHLELIKEPKLVVIPIYLTDRAVASPEFAKALGKRAEENSGYHLRADFTPDESKKLIDKIVECLVNDIFSRRTENTTEKIFGPFGVQNETSWRSEEIENGISIVYDMDRIKSITFKVREGADTKQQRRENGQGSTYEVKFEKEEHITSFAGCFDKKGITRLIFRTSKRILRPFDKMPEECFCVPSKEQKVTKFLAGGKHFLTSIGAHVESKFCPVIVQRVGLIGNRSKYKWDDGHHHANVSKIIEKGDSRSGTIRSIQSIEFEYEDRKWWQSETHGLTEGNNSTPEGENKRLTKIFGVWEDYNIKYLEFYAGEEVVKTIGVDENNGEKKSLSIPEGGKIVGFYGWRRGEHLCGIGAYFKRDPIPIPIPRGDGWDDKKFFGVREICLWLDRPNRAHIRAVGFVYDRGSGKDKTLHHPDSHTRGSSGEEEKAIKLDYPREYLTSISGCIRVNKDTREDDGITSLIFHSNRYTYRLGSSAKEEGRFFWYPSTGSRITGFYGTFHNKALQSIGVYAEAIPHIYAFKTIEPFGGTGGDYWDDGVHTDVRAFRVRRDDHGIRSISFMYDDNFSLVEVPQRGEWIWLDFPNERLLSITVWKGKKEKGKENIISHLEITTNDQTYGPYPAMPNTDRDKSEIKLYCDFRRDYKKGSCYNRVGFFGRAGSYLNAIGARYEPNY